MSLIRLLDISGHFHPIFRVKEAAGKPIGEVCAATVQTLRERAVASGADYVVACCDSGRTFRHAIGEEWRETSPEYRGYKGNRGEKDPAMMAALDRVISEIEQDGVPILRYPGFEADDVIATVTKWALAEGHEVEIFTEDKDLMQLVGPGVRVVRKDQSVVGPEEVEAKFGVVPARLGEYLAIVGDNADHVPGVSGMGKVAAVGLINKHGGYLPAVEKAREEERRIAAAGPDDQFEPAFTAKQRTALLAGEAAFRLSLRMTTLREDVPLDFAAVTGPRTPKPKPQSADWTARQERAESVAATTQDTFEEEQTMTESAIVTDTDHAPAFASPPAVVEATGIVVPGAEPKQSAALALARAENNVIKMARYALEPRSYAEARIAAEDAAESRLYKGIENAAQALQVIMKGRKYGLTVSDSLQMIHMIEGKPSMSAQLIIGLVMSSGYAEYIDFTDATETSATWETKRRGGRQPMKWTFTTDNARRALLGGAKVDKATGAYSDFDPSSNWSKHPKVMCLWRAGVFLCRAVYTDIVGGLYMPDEVGGAEPEIDGNLPTHGSVVLAT